ncbi:MAG: ATP-binding protein [Anaerolineae bacterium]|jgi:K+-sensing histidine kinase KdpD|nr:ATP-binding protein [Anaerolineae bacterium]
MPKFAEVLYQLAKQLNTETRLASLVHVALREIGKLFDAPMSFLVLFNDKGKPTDTIGYEMTNLYNRDAETWEVWLYSGVVGHIYHSQRTVILSNIAVDPRWGNLRQDNILPSGGSALGIPLLYQDRVIGALVCLHPNTGQFITDIIPLADEIGILLAGNVHKATLLRWADGQDIRDKLDQAQFQRDLSAMIYHDLRVPLQTLRASTSKLAELLANYGDVTVLNMLQINIRSVRQLRRLIDNLLDIERIESGESFIKTDWTNLNDVMSNAVDLVQPLALEASQHFQFILTDNLPPLSLDADMILRVIVNLIENALKYSPNGGLISIGARMKDGMVWVNVQDSGDGIPADMQQSIFEKFNRAHQQNNHNSVGLGLTFCKLAIEAHNGKIWVESEVGKGANFIFTLPLPFSDTDNANQSQLASTA